MLHLNGNWHDSVEELRAANPTAPIDESVRRDILTSSAWKHASNIAQDAAAMLCKSAHLTEYDQLAREVNNSEYGKYLSVVNGRVVWDGTLALRSTREITSGIEISATRGHAYWVKHGYPKRI